MMAEGRNGGVKMVNVIGLKRAGFSDETIRVIRNLFKIYCRSGLNHTNAIARIKAELPQIPEVLEFLEFCATSERGVLSGSREGHRN
jgi:UDP-N-acetylglucosamine acyltransferase